MALDAYLEKREGKEEEREATLYQGTRILTDEKAQAVADTPILTGDPEWDRLELEETSTEKPWLKNVTQQR
jgi:hypothetical protein